MKIEFAGLNQILEFILYVYLRYIKTEKFTAQNKVLLVLGQRAGAHREDSAKPNKYYFL
jgi:hypothetical protein